MSWEDEYTNEELRVGYLAYKKPGIIGSIVKKGNTYTVKIKNPRYSYGGEKVTVTEIEGKKEKQYHTDCTCWASRYRSTCEHQIAALYAITTKPAEQYLSAAEKEVINLNDQLKETDTEAQEAGNAPSLGRADYHYFSTEKMNDSVTIQKGMYDRAQKLIKEHSLITSSVNTIEFYDRNGEQSKGIVYNGKIYEKANGQEISTQNVSGQDIKDQNSAINYVPPNKKINAEIIKTRKNLGSVELRVKKDRVISAYCHVRRCYCSMDAVDTRYNLNVRDNLLCEHLTAAMIYVNEYIKKENPGDVTDKNAESFLKAFRNQKNAVSDKVSNVVLEPELYRDGRAYYARFNIGIEKTYKLKSLTGLCEKVQNNESIILGKNNVINFSLNEFDEKSRKVFKFIQDEVTDAQRKNRRNSCDNSRYYSGAPYEYISDTILLDGTKMDTFYDICSEYKDIEYNEKGLSKKGKQRIRCLEKKCKADITIDEVSDGADTAGILVTGKLPTMVRGANDIYFVDQEGLCRVDDESKNGLERLIDIADATGYFTLTVGRRHMAEFYHTVYPELERIANITDRITSQIQDIIPPEPEVTFYLDSIDNVLYCRATVQYGEVTHTPSDTRGRSSLNQVYRSYVKEAEVCEAIDKYFAKYDSQKDESMCDDVEKSYLVYRDGVDELMSLGAIKCTDNFQNRKVRQNTGIKIGVAIESDLLNLSITTDDISRDELIAILESYRLKRKYHVLKNGDFLDLQSSDIEIINQLTKACRTNIKELLGDKIKLPLYRALYVDKLLEENAEAYSHRDKTFRKLIKDFDFIKDSELEVPASLENVLRPYQTYGHRWIRTLMGNGFGGILADEMGLGKTLQIISVLLAEKNKGTALIVCPTSLVYNWQEEFHRFAPELKVEAVAGGVKQRRLQIGGCKEADVLITSYDLLKRDITEYQECSFEYMVIDEAQYIKNANTINAKTVKIVNAKHRFALTGTPIENRLSELWSIFDFCMPGFLYEYDSFKKELEAPIAKEKDAEASARLKKMIAPFILRRLKKDVLKDLPDKIEELRYAVMAEKQQKLYDSQILRITKQVEEESEADFNKNKIKLLAEITRARQLCCDPSLVVENYNGGSAKREAALELIQSAIEGEHRILVFSQFTTMLDMLAADLKLKDIDYYMLTGETSKEERVRLMKAFNEGDVPVFLISLKAGGTGLNLTGADVVLHYDPWWNIAVQNQATDRAHRIGQTKKVTVYKLIVKGSIEEKIVKLQESKKDLANEILSGEMGNLAAMSRVEMMEILKG